MSDILSYKTDHGRKSAHWSYGPSFDKVLPVHTEVTLATSPAPYTSRSLWESYQLDYWYDNVSKNITTCPSVCKIGSLNNDLFSPVQYFYFLFHMKLKLSLSLLQNQLPQQFSISASFPLLLIQEKAEKLPILTWVRLTGRLWNSLLSSHTFNIGKQRLAF